jgi:hypothetical protein
MQLWNRLYLTVRLAFLACVLIPRWMGVHVGAPVHVLLGLIIVIITWTNARSLAALPVPQRLMRISKAAMGFAIFQAIIGIAWAACTHLAPASPIILLIFRGIHVVCALAILAKTSSLATSYDMWEEKEFETTPRIDNQK